MLRIGIDLGGTKTEGVLMDADGRVLARERRVTPQPDGYDAILATVAETVRELEHCAGGACRIGIGTPGALSARTQTLKNSNTVCLNGKPVQADLERLLGRAIRLANDANCFTLSEARDGAAAGARVVFGVILGTGVGGGIVVNGHALDGAQHIAGEWGHNVLDPAGPDCYCGRQGCVETFLSGPGLARDYAAHGGDSSHSALDISVRATAGDTLAEAAMQRYVDRFGRALAVVINILDPDVVVLGGGLSNLDRLYTEGRDALARLVFNDELRTPLVRNVHGDSSGVLGAAQLWDPGE